MQGGRRKRNLRMAARRAGAIIGVGVATTVALLGVPGNASATAIGVEGSSDCAGPDAWVATWRISVTSASADETWRLDAPVGDAGFRSVAEPVVVEQVYAMDEPIAQLDVTITLVDAETTLSTSASMDWPTVCTSAPAPPVASGAVDPGDSTGDSTDDQAALTMTAPIDIGGPDPGTESTPATSARTRSIALAVAPSVSPGVNELPATGSTSSILAGIATACVAVGGLLLRLAGGPTPALADGAGRRPGRQRRSTSSSPHPKQSEPALWRQP